MRLDPGVRRDDDALDVDGVYCNLAARHPGESRNPSLHLLRPQLRITPTHQLGVPRRQKIMLPFVAKLRALHDLGGR